MTEGVLIEESLLVASFADGLDTRTRELLRVKEPNSLNEAIAEAERIKGSSDVGLTDKKRCS
jgi:hypothetical protein